MRFLTILVFFKLWIVMASPLFAGDASVAQSNKQIAQILVSDFPQADPMVLEHARQLIAGEPVKQWKNCLLQKTLDLARQEKYQSTLAELK